MKQDEFESLSIFEQATITPAYQQGFQAGAASRDAEIQRLQFALADSEALELGTAERCDQLRAQINVLRETLDGIRIANWREWDDGVRSADHFVDWAKSRAEFTLAATENP